MNDTAARPLGSVAMDHRLVTHRSVAGLMEWAHDFIDSELDNSVRVLWAPCHALGTSCSLQEWLLQQAGARDGDPANQDAPVLLSGACDVLVLIDPASADAASLRWLGDLMACSDAAKEISTVAPLPQLIVLTRTGVSSTVAEPFLDRLRALGATESRSKAKHAPLTAADVETRARGIASRNRTLLAALTILPYAPTEGELPELAKAAGVNNAAIKQLVSSGLFQFADDLLMPTDGDVRRDLRGVLDADTLKKAAKAALPFIQGRFPNSPHTTVEALLLSGDRKGGLKLARECFAQLYKAERYQDALRILNLCRRHELNLDDGRNPKVVDEATYACLNAEIGNFETARAIVSDLSRRRDLYKNPAFVEWLALAARKLAMEVGHEPRNADSLMRRAIRMANDDLDRDIRLTILRVKLLYSRVFQLDERAMWLLTHINNKMLKEVSQSTLALFLDETAGRMVDRGEFKGAMKRLRRLTAFDTMQFRQARTLMRMARCRAHFDDYEGAGRYASNALHAGLRSGNVEAVEEAVRFLREVEKMEPRDTARGKAGRRSRGRSRMRADLGLPAMQTPEADKLFDMLQKRFDVTWWVRRRGASVMTFGEQPTAQPEHASVFVEDDNGVVTRQAGGRYGRDGSFAVVLMRPEGDDLVILIPAEGTGPREEGIVRILQADRGTGDSGVVPSRAAVVEDYLRRASTQLTRRGLNHTMEMLFTKDVLIYLEEEGLTKDEMADKLGVSRATLYRMYARCGLN